MGYLKERYGISMFGKVADGTCPECRKKHDPKMPHNKLSLVYQYRFYDKYGRFPTWADAMAHCTDEVKEEWTQALRDRGIEV